MHVFCLLLKVRNDGSGEPDFRYDLIAEVYPEREESEVKGSVFWPCVSSIFWFTGDACIQNVRLGQALKVTHYLYAVVEQHNFDMLISRTVQSFHTSNKGTYSDRRSLRSPITKYF